LVRRGLAVVVQLGADGMRLDIAFPMASAAPEAKSDRSASAMRVIETHGKHLLCSGDAQALRVIASPVSRRLKP
jgi:hypothetical protein